MIETVALAQAASLAPTAPVATGPVARAPADADAVARFGELMAAAPVPAPPVAQAPVAASIAGAFPLRAATLGDQVLGGLQQVQNDFHAKLQQVNRLFESGAPAPGVGELLRLQLGMAQMSVQLEVVGKAVSRSTQNIDQLVRMQ